MSPTHIAGRLVSTPMPSLYLFTRTPGGREGGRSLIRDVDERRKGGELHSSDRLQQKPTWEHPHARGADECANVDMERTTNAAREGEKVSSARWAFTLEALQIDRICTALSPSIFIAPLRIRNLS